MKKFRLESSLSAPPPGVGEVRHTPLPDDFSGIRWEIGRMARYVQDARKDPLVIDAARMVGAHYCRFAAEMSGRMGTPVDPNQNKTLLLEGIDTFCRHYLFFCNDPTNVEVMQTPGRMVRQTRVAKEALASIMEPFYRAMEEVDPSFSRSSYEPPAMFVGDCVPFSQKVIVRDRSDHSYKVVSMGDLKDVWKYYHVVSYNEGKRKFEFKPISAFVVKGKLPVCRVSLSNGTSFRCTENHELYAFRRNFSAKESSLCRMTLGELVLEKASKRSHSYTLPIAARIPEAGMKSRFVPQMSSAQLWTEGLYVAEGWSETMGRGKRGNVSKRAKIGMNNPHAITALKTNLAVMGQEFGEHLRKDGLVTIRMNTSPFTTRLGSRFGKDSGDKRFPKWYTSLSRDQLSVLLSAYALGDGYVPTHGKREGFLKLVYNTKSEVLADQLRFMHMVLGRPLYVYKQAPWHEKPAMYRLHEWKKGYPERLPDLCAVRIQSIEKDGEEECCDITVLDNHNFVLENGALVHNCEEAICMELGMCAALDISPVRFRFGGNGGTLHHVWGRVHADGRWWDSDVTEPGYRLGDFTEFEDYDEFEVPL